MGKKDDKKVARNAGSKSRREKGATVVICEV